ncbi:hypothetical protein ACS0PU_013103 [Formica fusca]
MLNVVTNFKFEWNQSRMPSSRKWQRSRLEKNHPFLKAKKKENLKRTLAKAILSFATFVLNASRTRIY